MRRAGQRAQDKFTRGGPLGHDLMAMQDWNVTEVANPGKARDGAASLIVPASGAS
jgi:hypothetical protein